MSFSFRGTPARGQLLRSVRKFFEQDDWHFDQEDSVLTMRFAGEAGAWRCAAVVQEEREQFLFYSILDTKVPADLLMRAAEYITRANWGLQLGNFELDWSDGEVRYKTSIDVEGGALTFEMSRNLVYSNCSTLDRYLPGLMRVIYGEIEPAAAIAAIETDGPAAAGA